MSSNEIQHNGVNVSGTLFEGVSPGRCPIAQQGRPSGDLRHDPSLFVLFSGSPAGRRVLPYFLLFSDIDVFYVFYLPTVSQAGGITPGQTNIYTKEERLNSILHFCFITSKNMYYMRVY